MLTADFAALLVRRKADALCMCVGMHYETALFMHAEIISFPRRSALGLLGKRDN